MFLRNITTYLEDYIKGQLDHNMKNHCHENIRFISVGGMSSEVVLWVSQEICNNDRQFERAVSRDKLENFRQHAHKKLHRDWSGVLSKNANICDTERAAFGT
jgi:hypothetical protein